ncbi:MAG: hypothetical protein WCV43_08820 [Candidatus Caldatribacteriota bacterium]|jgi:hypothetical protein
MKIIVIEPHPDDAFLSVGWHLEKVWKDDERTILTVYANARRGKEAEQYAKSIGARSIVLGLEESLLWSSGPIRIVEPLRMMLDGLEWDTIVFPIGLQHPDHRRVSATRPSGSLLYLDTPYQSKLKNNECLNRRIDGRTIHSIVFPPKQKWKRIEVFKSQAKFFYFNPFHSWKLPEVILA